MSESSNPFAAAFDIERRSIDGTRRALHWGVEVGKRTNRLAVDSVESGESVQRAGTEVTHTAMTATMDAMAASVPGSQEAMQSLEEMVDEQFEAAEAVNGQVWSAFHEVLAENARASEAFADRYLEMVDDTTEDTLEALSAFEDEMGAATQQMRPTE
jgi:hypothetical protein